MNGGQLHARAPRPLRPCLRGRCNASADELSAYVKPAADAGLLLPGTLRRCKLDHCARACVVDARRLAQEAKRLGYLARSAFKLQARAARKRTEPFA